MPGHSRATRGIEYKHQPRKRFALNVKARLEDGHSLRKSEKVGSDEQGYLGPVIDEKVPYIATTSRADFLSAFNKRANYHTSQRIDPKARGIIVGMIKKLVPVPMPTISWDPELYRTWLNQFDLEKQVRMEKAYHAAGLNNISDFSNKQIFTKIEALIKDPEVVAPRLIFKGTDYYNMVAGPLFKELLDRFVLVENSLDKLKFKISYKQHTPEIVEFLEGQPSRSYIEADFTANDKTQVKDVGELERMLMLRLGCPRWFLALHKASNRFSTYNSKYGLSAIVENQLPSGAVDGTFRNTFWNLSILNVWMRLYKIPIARAVILGDDMLAGLSKRHRRSSRHYKQVARMCCMEAKVTTHPLLHNCHFLSKHFVPVCREPNAHVMLPMVGKILAKFNVRPNANQSVTDDEYMAGKSLSHCYEFRYCHVLRDVFKDRANYHLARSGGKFSMEGISWHVKVHGAFYNDINAMLMGSMGWPDLVTSDDLGLFWLGLCDLPFSDVFAVFKDVVLDPDYRVIHSVASKSLVDY